MEDHRRIWAIFIITKTSISWSHGGPPEDMGDMFLSSKPTFVKINDFLTFFLKAWSKKARMLAYMFQGSVDLSTDLTPLNRGKWKMKIILNLMTVPLNYHKRAKVFRMAWNTEKRKQDTINKMFRWTETKITELTYMAQMIKKNSHYYYIKKLSWSIQTWIPTIDENILFNL